MDRSSSGEGNTVLYFFAFSVFEFSTALPGIINGRLEEFIASTVLAKSPACIAISRVRQIRMSNIVVDCLKIVDFPGVAACDAVSTRRNHIMGAI